VGEACGIKDRKQKCIQGFGGGTYRKETYLEDLGTDGRLTFKISRK
jgi:hypothetical protein